MLAALLEASSAEDVVKAANRMSNACSASSSDAMVVDVIDLPALERGRKEMNGKMKYDILSYVCMTS